MDGRHWGFDVTLQQSCHFAFIPCLLHELNYREEMEPQIGAAGMSNSSVAAGISFFSTSHPLSWDSVLPHCTLPVSPSAAGGEASWLLGFMHKPGSFCFGEEEI
jgi:hypothetical protein